MTKALTILTITSVLFFVFLGGCSQTKLGKVDLSSWTPPNFLEMGKTTVRRGFNSDRRTIWLQRAQ